MISWFLTLFMIITYLLMKEKRSFPSNIITCLSVALYIFFFTTVFMLGDPARVRCADAITMSLPPQDLNPLCRTQGIDLSP